MRALVVKLDTYRFADYKHRVIDPPMRVTMVSVQPMRFVEAMKVACPSTMRQAQKSHPRVALLLSSAALP